MEYKVVFNPDDIVKKEWENFVYDHPSCNPFQTPQMFELFCKVEHYESKIAVIYNDEGKITGILSGIIQKEPGFKCYFSKRCIVWGGPLVKDNNHETASILLRSFVKSLNNKSIYIEFRNLFPLEKFKELFSSLGFIWRDHLNFIVTTDTRENVIKRLSRSKWRQITKALARGVEIIEAENLNQIEQFYHILEKLYSTKIKKPLPPFNFFKSFFNNKLLGKYFLIKYKKKIIGGIMCPVYKDTIYELYVASLDNNEYKTLYPGVLVTWAPVEYALNNKLKYFDFMGAGSPDSDYGVREFKSKFGGKMVNYGRFVRINKPFLYQAGKLGLTILHKIK